MNNKPEVYIKERNHLALRSQKIFTKQDRIKTIKERGSEKSNPLHLLVNHLSYQPLKLSTVLILKVYRVLFTRATFAPCGSPI